MTVETAPPDRPEQRSARARPASRGAGSCRRALGPGQSVLAVRVGERAGEREGGRPKVPEVRFLYVDRFAGVQRCGFQPAHDNVALLAELPMPCARLGGAAELFGAEAGDAMD